MGNNQTLHQNQTDMKNSKLPTPVEEVFNEKRKTSASVDEIRDLYSALQELVPSSTLKSSSTGFSSEKESSDASSSGSRQNLAPLIRAKRSSSPLPSRTQPKVVLRRNRSHSLDAQMGFPNLSEQMARRDSMYEYRQGKRLLKSKKRIHEELRTIIKDFDEAEIDGNRIRSRSMNTVLEAGSSEQSTPIIPARPRSFTDVCEEDVICDTDRGEEKVYLNPEITGRRNRSQSLQLNTLLELAGPSEEQSAHVSDPTRPCYEEETICENGKVLPEDKQTTEKNKDDIKNYLIPKKRLSAGDILEARRKRYNESKGRYRRRSIGGSLLLNAIVSSTSVPTPNRKASLANALSLIANKTKLQELIKNCQDKLSKEENSNVKSDETDHGNTETVAEANQETRSSDLQKEVNILLASIKELQQDSGNFDENQNSLEDIEDTRRGSIASVGTEMHNLLEALGELMISVGEETTPNSTPSGSTANSRKTSFSDIRVGTQKESLEELEAYFKSKLENISEGRNTSSTDGQSKLSKEKNKSVSNDKKYPVGIESRRHSAPKVNSNAKSSVQSSKTAVSQQINSDDLLKPCDAFRDQRPPTQNFRSRFGNRRRSRSVQDIKLPERTERMLAKEMTANSRSPSSSTSRFMQQDMESNADDEAVRAKSRALWKEDQLLFADQVNKRLQDWLERATAMSLQEEQEEKAEEDTALRIDNLSVASSDNDSVYYKPKKSPSRFAMKKILRKKIRRSKSVSNLSEPELERKPKSPRFKRLPKKKLKRSKSLQSIDDKDEFQETKPTSKPLILRSPQSLLRIGRLLRSKPMHGNLSKKSSLDSLERRATESDESFDDGNSTFFVKRSLSRESSERAQSIDSQDTNSDNQEITVEHSDPKKKGKNLSKNQTPHRTQKNVKLFSNDKRVSRFPEDLPLFYAPGSDTPTLQTLKDERYSQHLNNNKRRMERKSLLMGESEANHKLFYEGKQSPATVGMAAAFPFLLNTAPSQQMDTSRLNSVSDEGYIKSPNQNRLNDSSTTFQDFSNISDEFRERAKSTDSEDSGCPDITDI